MNFLRILPFTYLTIGLLAPCYSQVPASPIQAKISNNDFLDGWVKNGQYFDVIIHHTVLSYYIGNNGQWILLNNIDGLNKMLRNEFVSRQAAIGFLSDGHFPVLVKDLTSGQQGLVLNQKSANDIQQGENPAKILEVKAYLHPPKLHIDQNHWSMNFSVYTADGGLQSWLISGDLEPLSVISYSRSTVVPTGSLSGFSVTR